MLRSRKKQGFENKEALTCFCGSLILMYIYCANFCPEMLFLKLYPEETLQSVHSDLTQNMFTLAVFVQEKCEQTKHWQ